MPYYDVVQRSKGRDRAWVSPIDEFRASDFTRAFLSGATNYTSGQSIYSGVVSNVVRIRPVRFGFHNHESSPMTVTLRDGAVSGSPEVVGPFNLTPLQDRQITKDMLQGAYFLSSVAVFVLSGTYAAGITVNLGYVLEPIETEPGGELE